MDLNIGIIVLGQTPRDDIMEIFSQRVPGVKVSIKGALDELSLNDINKLTEARYYPLFVRLKDGGTREISMNAIRPFIESSGKDLAKEGSNLLIVWCCGQFEKFDIDIPVIYPNEMVSSILECICTTKKLDTLIPNASQYSSSKQTWTEKGFLTNILTANPLNEDVIKSSAMTLSRSDGEILLLDCMSYSMKHVDLIKDSYKRPIICPQFILPKLIFNLYKCR